MTAVALLATAALAVLTWHAVDRLAYGCWGPEVAA